MKQAIVYASEKGDFAHVSGLLNHGWILHQTIPGLNGVAFHLIRLGEGELNVTNNKYQNVLDVRQLRLPQENGDVARLVEEGFEVVAVLKDCVQLLRRGPRPSTLPEALGVG